jgi:integrase
MSLSRMPNGRWRAQVYDSRTKSSVSAAKILGLKQASFGSKADAKIAREQARMMLRQRTTSSSEMTVRGWWDLWTTHPVFQRPKAATNINNREMTRSFVQTYGGMLLADVDHRVVSEWVLSGGAPSAIKFLRTMFSDAMSPRAGELVARNPFAKMAPSSSGNAQKKPPSVELAWRMINHAWETEPPGFAAWLQVACFSGMRTCELDALKWSRVDLDGGWITVDLEFCSKSFMFCAPKNGRTRRVPLHAPARDALERLAEESEFVFTNASRGHWSRNSRAYPWNRVRRANGWDGTLYLATRHFAGWWLYNRVRLSAEDVAAALGHEDRGMLVRRLYGHFEHDEALERVKVAVAAYENDELARRRAA